MTDAYKQEDLKVSSSNVPLIRAGYANIIFFLLIIGLILLNQALVDLALFLRWIPLLAFFVLIMKIYVHSVSKILVKNEKNLVIVGPFYRTEFSADEILEAKVYGIPSSMTIFLIFRMKSVRLPKIYFFVSVLTNYGSYSDTRTKLQLLLNELGVGST